MLLRDRLGASGACGDAGSAHQRVNSKARSASTISPSFGVSSSAFTPAAEATVRRMGERSSEMPVYLARSIYSEGTEPVARTGSGALGLNPPPTRPTIGSFSPPRPTPKFSPSRFSSTPSTPLTATPSTPSKDS